MLLDVRSLVAGYGGVPVLHGLDIRVNDGEAVALVGANGAGKSTLVRAICGLARPFSGQIIMAGQDITAVPPHLRARHGIAVALEERNLFPELTVADNLRLSEAAGRRVPLPAGARPMTRDDVFALFPEVRGKLGSRVELLSGGQQQMVVVARALLLQPRLLVLDELTTGLAPKIVQEILGTLLRLRERGLSLLIVEQSVKLAAEMTDRSYVLASGRVVREVSRSEWPSVLADDSLTRAYLHG